MKRIATIAAVVGAVLASSVGAANAQVLEFGIGPGPYVAVSPGPVYEPYPYPYRHRWRNYDADAGAYAYVPQCYFVRREHFTKWGTRIYRRERVCD